MAIKIGITGGIGSGKSVVSHLLEVMGVPVYISDEESKKVVATDPVIRKELCDLVGEEVFSGGKLNKTLLATYLFASSTHASQVNGIIHPRVKEHFRQWRKGFSLENSHWLTSCGWLANIRLFKRYSYKAFA